MNINKIISILERIIGFEGSINISLNNHSIKLNNKSVVGDALESWLGKYLDDNISETGVSIEENTVGQTFPDFYLNSDTFGTTYLEVKTFDINAGANFDIANFNSYVDSLIENPDRINADYLVVGYSLNNSKLKIEKFWIKKVWELCCPSEKWSLKLQVKRNMIYNIRPCNLTGKSKYLPFYSKENFIDAIQEVLTKYSSTEEKYRNWKEKFYFAVNQKNGL
ncbi:MAG: NgoBV family restriction endonuclease [Cetobacterium sp.]